MSVTIVCHPLLPPRSLTVDSLIQTESTIDGCATSRYFVCVCLRSTAGKMAGTAMRYTHVRRTFQAGSEISYGPALRQRGDPSIHREKSGRGCGHSAETSWSATGPLVHEPSQYEKAKKPRAETTKDPSKQLKNNVSLFTCLAEQANVIDARPTQPGDASACWSSVCLMSGVAPQCRIVCSLEPLMQPWWISRTSFHSGWNSLAAGGTCMNSR